MITLCSFQCWFSFRLGRTQLQTDQVHAEDPVEKMLAVPNRPQKANDWFYTTASNSYTRADLAMTVPPIHIDQEYPNCKSGPRSYFVSNDEIYI